MYRDGLILASLATEAILLLKAGTTDDVAAADFQHALASDALLQQAAGIVSEFFNVPITDAMILIRSKAFSSNYSLAELARVIVQRELSLKDW
jgi:AmiR/NasT family two-component response regulator